MSGERERCQGEGRWKGESHPPGSRELEQRLRAQAHGQACERRRTRTQRQVHACVQRGVLAVQLQCGRPQALGLSHLDHLRRVSKGQASWAAGTLQDVSLSWCGRAAVACVRTDRVWRSGTGGGKQPVNLAVERAEESLSILSDYTPTVRPPPKRC
jgi:hypothetical protein